MMWHTLTFVDKFKFKRSNSRSIPILSSLDSFPPKTFWLNISQLASGTTLSPSLIQFAGFALSLIHSFVFLFPFSFCHAALHNIWSCAPPPPTHTHTHQSPTGHPRSYTTDPPEQTAATDRRGAWEVQPSRQTNSSYLTSHLAADRHGGSVQVHLCAPSSQANTVVPPPALSLLLSLSLSLPHSRGHLHLHVKGTDCGEWQRKECVCVSCVHVSLVTQILAFGLLACFWRMGAACHFLTACLILLLW